MKISFKMKSKILAFFLTLASAGVFAQQPAGPHYLFTTYSSAFTPLEESVSLDEGMVWDDPSWTVPLGFSFYTANDTIDLISIGELGASVFGIQNDALTDMFLPSLDDICNANEKLLVSPVSYVVEGPPGFQICKIEWLNVGFYEDGIGDGIFSNTLSFQLWLYENSNIFEYRFGPSSIPNPEIVHAYGGPAMGFIENFDQNSGGFNWDGFYSITGNPTDPTILNLTPNDILMSEGMPSNALLSSHPSDGTVYRFTPTFVGVEEASVQLFEVFPNPTNGILNIFNPTKEVVLAQIISADGKIVQVETLNSGRNFIQTENLSSGYYILRANGTSTSFLKN
jgi:hypothetical protein